MSNIILAIALSIDSLAVSFCCDNSREKTRNLKRAVLIAGIFAVTQGIFVLAGQFLGQYAASFVKAVDHWFAAAILGAIGGKMLLEGLAKDQTCKCKDINELRPLTIISLAVATSIDAVVAGFGVSLAGLSSLELAVYTGIVTFILSFTGILLGQKVGETCGRKIEIAGGLLLILMGLKILADHLINAI